MKTNTVFFLLLLIIISLSLNKICYSLFSDNAFSASNSFSAADIFPTPSPDPINQVSLIPQNILHENGWGFPLNQDVEINLILETGEFETESLEVIINFDPQVISVNSVDFTTNTIPYLNSSLIEEIDNEQGIIYLARTIYSLPYDPPYNPIPYLSQGIVGTITINTLQINQNSSLTFDFQPGGLNDCNLVRFQQAEDVLESAINLDFSIIN